MDREGSHSCVQNFWRLVGTVAALSVLASGCLYESSGECSNDADCFQGESCVDGTCRVAIPGDSGPGDTSGPAPDTESSPPDSNRADTAIEPSDTDTGERCFDPPGPVGVCSTFAENPSACDAPTLFEPAEQSCHDGEDNDCDGTTDCRDPDCKGRLCGSEDDRGHGAVCRELECVEAETRCGDGADNDNDMSSDCHDSDCAGRLCGMDVTCPKPEAYEPDAETSCGDGVDNDCDGLIDAEDSDCETQTGAKRAGDSCSSDGECRSWCHIADGGDPNSSGTCVHRLGLIPMPVPGDFISSNMDVDHLCNAAASGTWKAVVGVDQKTPDVRIRIVAPVYNMAGKLITADTQALWYGSSELQNPVGYHSIQGGGASVSSLNDAAAVWTGTETAVQNGSGVQNVGRTCANWSTNSSEKLGRAGDPRSTSGTWLSQSAIECNFKRYVYCIDGQ